MEDMAFGAQITFFTYFDESTTEWEYYPTQGFNFSEAYGGSCFLLGDTFYSVGGIEIDKFTGLEGEINKDIWTFDFIQENGQTLEKQQLICPHIKLCKKTVCFICLATQLIQNKI